MLMLDFVLYNLMYFFCGISQFYETFILNIEILSSPTASSKLETVIKTLRKLLLVIQHLLEFLCYIRQGLAADNVTSFYTEHTGRARSQGGCKDTFASLKLFAINN